MPFGSGLRLIWGISYKCKTNYVSCKCIQTLWKLLKVFKIYSINLFWKEKKRGWIIYKSQLCSQKKPQDGIIK